MGHGGEFWQNVVHWRKAWQTTSVFLPWEPHEQYEKEVTEHWKMNSPGQFSSVQFSCSVVSDSLRPHESQHSRPPCPSPTPRVHSDSRPSSQWCHPAISSSVVPFSSCPQSLPASVFSNESTLLMRWPKYLSFSFSIIPSRVSRCPICYWRSVEK